MVPWDRFISFFGMRQAYRTDRPDREIRYPWLMRHNNNDSAGSPIMTTAHHLLIADDHPLFREAMSHVILAELPGCRLTEAADLDATLAAIASHSDLDLVLLDLHMPGVTGLDGLARVREAAPDIAVLMISAAEDKQLVLRAIEVGAAGYITKSSPRERIGQALQQVLAGNVYLPPDIIRGAPGNRAVTRGVEGHPTLSDALVRSLTERQRRVLERMALGESNKQIAWALNITETTVKTHVSAILGKLGVNNRVQAVLAAGDYLARQPSSPHEG